MCCFEGYGFQPPWVFAVLLQGKVMTLKWKEGSVISSKMATMLGFTQNSYLPKKVQKTENFGLFSSQPLLTKLVLK